MDQRFVRVRVNPNPTPNPNPNRSPNPHQAPWISEMYGYALAAAEAGLKHLLTDGVVVYPDRLGASHFEEARTRP